MSYTVDSFVANDQALGLFQSSLLKDISSKNHFTTRLTSLMLCIAADIRPVTGLRRKFVSSMKIIFGQFYWKHLKDIAIICHLLINFVLVLLYVTRECQRTSFSFMIVKKNTWLSSTQLYSLRVVKCRFLLPGNDLSTAEL